MSPWSVYWERLFLGREKEETKEAKGNWKGVLWWCSVRTYCLGRSADAEKCMAEQQVEVFMDAAFDVVRRDIGLLQMKLRTLNIKLASKKATLPAAERVGEATAQQCEASLQVLQSLCQTSAFRDLLLHHQVCLSSIDTRVPRVCL